MRVVALACLQAGVKDLKLNWARVDVYLVFQKRRRVDVDNLMGRCKPIFDSLVGMGILVDDSQEHLLPVLSVLSDPQRPAKTILQIWDRSEA